MKGLIEWLRETRAKLIEWLTKALEFLQGGSRGGSDDET